jgi:hypothetical protein
MVAEERHAMNQGIFSPSVRSPKSEPAKVGIGFKVKDIEGRKKGGNTAEAQCKACTNLGTVAEATVIEESCKVCHSARVDAGDHSQPTAAGFQPQGERSCANDEQ